MSRVFINKLDILAFVEQISETQTNTKIKQWVKSNVKNFLLKKYRGVKEVTDVSTPNTKTVEMAIANGEMVFHLNLSTKLRTEILHIIDFLNSDSAPKNFVRLDYIAARNHTKTWVKNINKENKDAVADTLDQDVMHVFDNGYKLICLRTEEEFKEEGARMKHCVSSYWRNSRATDNNSVILSVRRADNVAIATIEAVISRSFNGQEKCVVKQFKGRSNVGMIDPSVARDLDIFFKSKYKPFYWQDESAFGPGIYLKSENKHVQLALWPENSVYDGNLDLENSEIRMLPKGLTIKGNLYLENCPIPFIGDNLIVEGDLDIRNTQVVVIDDTVDIKGRVLNSEQSLLISYPDTLNL